MTTTLESPAPAHRATLTPDRWLRANPALVLALVYAGAAGAVGLWWFDTPTVTGPAEWLTGAGRITGLLAGYAMAVLVGLMARVPALERGVGTDRLTRWHALGGRYVVSLVVAHAALTTWGYAVAAHTGVVSEGASLLRDYGDVLLATLGGLLLVVVGVVSARAARKRMRYETWHLIHLGTYVAIGLAFAHQFSVGADFSGHPVAQAVWSLLYLSVGALLVNYRVVAPVRQALRHRIVVDAVRPEGPGVVSVYLRGRHLDELRAEPGQFFRWRFLARHHWWAANPYSLSAPATSGSMRITVKELGDHSARLADLRPGMRVVAEGPYGAFTAGRRRQRKVLLVGAGVGITPLRALFETLPGQPGDLTLVYRATAPGDLVLREELEDIAVRRRARLYFVTGSRAEYDDDPLSSEALQRMAPHLRHHDVYVCGPDGFSGAVRDALRRAGVPQRRIHHESFEF
ncbi:ferric reductase-like transmembrane domain-containing protein [Cryptosporangium sp. NPDC051539]|uniref:ferredoxin reductase family protein n=1 Tax=Cryptosporangium sp. NPDC051539 TaxID=3363962 RepID=UPI00379534D0